MSGAFKAQGSKLNRSGTPIAECVNIDRSGAKADLLDVTNMDSTGGYREKIPGLLDPGEITVTANHLGNASATQATLQADFDGQVLNDWTIDLPNGKGTYSFNAYVTDLSFKLPHDKQAEFGFKLTITGPVAFA
jgi:predicted secreted protein